MNINTKEMFYIHYTFFINKSLFLNIEVIIFLEKIYSVAVSEKPLTLVYIVFFGMKMLPYMSVNMPKPIVQIRLLTRLVKLHLKHLNQFQTS